MHTHPHTFSDYGRYSMMLQQTSIGSPSFGGCAADVTFMPDIHGYCIFYDVTDIDIQLIFNYIKSVGGVTAPTHTSHIHTPSLRPRLDEVCHISLGDVLSLLKHATHSSYTC